MCWPKLKNHTNKYVDGTKRSFVFIHVNPYLIFLPGKSISYYYAIIHTQLNPSNSKAHHHTYTKSTYSIVNPVLYLDEMTNNTIIRKKDDQIMGQFRHTPYISDSDPTSP